MTYLFIDESGDASQFTQDPVGEKDMLGELSQQGGARLFKLENGSFQEAEVKSEVVEATSGDEEDETTYEITWKAVPPL